MRTTALVTIAIGLLSAPLAAQETKKVPKDSARVSIAGCSKGYVFTAGPRSVEHPGSVDVPEGMHLRMNGPKSVIADIKAHEGSAIEITGIMKKGRYRTGRRRHWRRRQGRAGPAPNGGLGVSVAPRQSFIDVEAWRPIER